MNHAAYLNLALLFWCMTFALAIAGIELYWAINEDKVTSWPKACVRTLKIICFVAFATLMTGNTMFIISLAVKK